MEENSQANSLATVMTFYSNLADEVDQHFTRALHSANADVHSQDGTLPHMYEYGKHDCHSASYHRKKCTNVQFDHIPFA